MKYVRFIASLILALVSLTAIAQPPVNQHDRARWIQEIRSYKHEFMAKELSLSKDQQRKFFPLYDQMEDEIERLNSETRELEIKADTPEATDLELQNAARTIFEQKRAEGQVEMTYFEKFKDILTPRQLLRLKCTERKFMQKLVNTHRRTKMRKEAKQQ